MADSCPCEKCRPECNLQIEVRGLCKPCDRHSHRNAAWPYPSLGNPFESAFNRSGLVPYPCTHGLAVLPPGHQQIHRQPRIDKTTGGELPPWGSQSWGRSKYLKIIAYGSKDGAPFSDARCPICIGEPRPSGMTEVAS